MFGSESLRNCSIGKLNLYVQNVLKSYFRQLIKEL